MQIVREFPFEVEEKPHLWIPMPDGTRLSARMWKPVTDTPVPAVLEFLPYRKRDGTAERDALTHPYMAGHGYVCVRVDMRGCGDSEGLFDDEYSPQELSDGVAVVEWLAAQEWCNGNVGMMGISWGGFNGLQIAALKPEPLKAVVSICSTVDRYADDIHYKGGTMLGENPAWAATVLGWFALPPDPEVVGENWRAMWLERLENTPFLADTWVTNQLRDDYWRHGSVCEDYSAISAAVLSVGGWHDGYRNTISHLVENLEAPVKGLIGPWIHKYPHFAVPGPRIDFLGEMLRWWDRWLKGIDNGVEHLPDMRRWVMDSMPPQTSYVERPGRWIADDKAAVQSPLESWHLVENRLQDVAGTCDRTIHPALFCGEGAGEYFPFGFGPGELPDDQRTDDALSCCFDTAKLPVAKDIVGRPVVRLSLASDKPAAQVAVRLSDVRPDGKSTLISHGVLNLRHRNGHETPEDLPIGGVVDVEVTLDSCAYRVPEGHQLRVAMSSSYWPYIWPEAALATLSLESGVLELPVRESDVLAAPVFDEPRSAEPRKTRVLTEPKESKRVVRDHSAKSATMEIFGETGKVEDLATGLIMSSSVTDCFTIVDGDPCSAESASARRRTMQRGDWQVEIDANIRMRTDGRNFIMIADLLAVENGEEVFRREWESVIPRL
ncbi:CocE/NonD family hydrolase [Shimia marina]|uniref:Cocaine esterase n=1 Tax=Shimia marina TaxID=321267 RepID=A0A0N7LSL8_9RHOB|nr:CocE/NonD family hydrolase [Shimia marina]CUH53980.1 Cocaine esterase [Shimia marina]SFE17734.1 hypothetical protein SAMN04488037_10662 [Shimia marina]